MQSLNQHGISAEPLATEGGHKPDRAISQDALAILGDGREATLATLRPDGWPQATIINYVNDEAQIYFDCAVDSQKAHNIARDDRVSLAMVAPYAAYGPIYGLSLAGHAQLLEAPADISDVLKIWKARYPYMQERLEHDLHGFAFYAIAPTVVTTLDYTAGLGHRD